MSAMVIARVLALASLAVVMLIATGPLRPLYRRVEAWTWQRDERTWVAHGVILLVLGFDAVVLGLWWGRPWLWLGIVATAWLAGWYAGKERVGQGGMTTDNWMDFLTPQLGAFLGVALGLVLG